LQRPWTLASWRCETIRRNLWGWNTTICDGSPAHWRRHKTPNIRRWLEADYKCWKAI
jgi:hypothetical protein